MSKENYIHGLGQHSLKPTYKKYTNSVKGNHRDRELRGEKEQLKRLN